MSRPQTREKGYARHLTQRPNKDAHDTTDRNTQAISAVVILGVEQRPQKSGDGNTETLFFTIARRFHHS